MSILSNKTQENKHPTLANKVSPKQCVGEPVFHIDNRPGAIAQRDLQNMANNSPQVKQLKALQKMVNNSLQVKQLKQVIPGGKVLQAVWQDAPDWQGNLADNLNPQNIIAGADFTNNHVRVHAEPHRDDMNIFADRYDGRMGAFAGRNTVVLWNDVVNGLAAVPYDDIDTDNIGNYHWSAWIDLANQGYEWGPLNQANAVNRNNVRLDVRNTWDSIEVRGFVRGNWNQNQQQYVGVDFKVTHLHDSGN